MRVVKRMTCPDVQQEGQAEPQNKLVGSDRQTQSECVWWLSALSTRKVFEVAGWAVSEFCKSYNASRGGESV